MRFATCRNYYYIFILYYYHFVGRLEFIKAIGPGLVVAVEPMFGMQYLYYNIYNNCYDSN